MTVPLRRAVRVRVPATSANLGPGFDALGLALGLHDQVEVRVTSGGLLVDVTGEGAGAVPRDASHLVARALLQELGRLGAQPAGLHLICRNGIPHSRGLGSSAAAAAAGALAAHLLAGSGPDAAVPAVLAAACRLEGHADNAAAALLGSAAVAWTARSGPRAARLDVHPDIAPVVLLPEETLLTSHARALLPGTVPHGDAAHAAGRAALLVEALGRRPDLLLDATEDRLHQRARGSAMPATLRLVDSLRARGLAAVVSGAGPAVLVLHGEVASRDVPAGWRHLALPVDRTGAVGEVLADPVYANPALDDAALADAARDTPSGVTGTAGP